MSNADTISAITDNVERLLGGEGMRFSVNTYKEVKNIPASLLPLGRIFYEGEVFNYSHGEKPSYGEAELLVKVVFREKDHSKMTRELQSWVHKVREIITVGTLNTGKLAATKYVSSVMTPEAVVESKGISVEHMENISILSQRVVVRYREV